MTDEQWDTLLPEVRTKILSRGEAIMGGVIYTLPKDKFYEFCDKSLEVILNTNNNNPDFLAIEKMRQAVKEYDEAMAAKAAMEG